ncbi:hypothetical protein ACHAXR_006431 [Thalassiosira sp. AJA248-18]
MAPRTRAIAVLLSRSLLFSATVQSSSRTIVVGSSAFFSGASQLHHNRRPAASRSYASTAQLLFHPSSLKLVQSTHPYKSSRLFFVRGGSNDSNSRGDNQLLGAKVSDISDDDDEPRTGWLHNTEPKYYTPPGADPTNDSSPAMKRLLIEKMKGYRNHRLINPPAIHPCGDNRRMVVTEHKIAVPLCHADLESTAGSATSDSITTLDRVDGGYNTKESFDRHTVDVYFTIMELVSTADDEKFFSSLADLTITPQQRAAIYLQRSPVNIDASRMILYLQGGPGFGCTAPVSGLSLASAKSSWAASALFGDITNLEGKTFERVVLMDQRGTGRSSPISKQRLKKMFPDLFLLDDCASEAGELAKMQLAQAKVNKAVAEATEYLAKFRADSIVRDAEWIKEALIRPSPTMMNEAEPEDNSPKPWGAALGQSFGGFCLMTYLSSITHPPKLCLFTGGIAPMNTPVREVYDRLWLRVKERSCKYYDQYPGDIALVKRIAQRLMLQESDPSQPPVKLPSGGILTARRFLQLGLALGGSPGSSFANLHSVINSAFLDDDGDDELSETFLKGIDYEQSFDDAPLYFMLHESIYADGPSSGATNWAAHASYEQYVSSNPEFDYRVTSKSDEAPTLFFGEMVFPWMAHGDFAKLSGNGMRVLSEAVSAKNDWSPLFDASNMRSALGSVGKTLKSKAASATYYDDMYVDFNCAMKLVKRGAPLEGVKVWVTNEYQHSGLRDDGANIVCRLVGMAKGSIHLPS